MLYIFAKEQYAEKINVKNEIRKRASLIFTTSLPFISTLAFFSINFSEQISNVKLIILIFSLLFLVASIFFFFLLVIPSYQLKHDINEILRDCKTLYEREEIVRFFETINIDDLNEKERVIALHKKSMAYEYFSNVYKENIEAYEDKNIKFKFYFSFFVITISISFILLVFSIGV